MWTRLSFSWRLASLGLAWLGGTFAHLQLAVLPDAASLAAWLGAAVAGGAAAAWRPRWRLLLVPAVAALSFGLASVQASWRLADALPVDLEREDLVVQGVVASLPQVFEQGVRFRFEVESAHHGNGPVQVPAVVQLGWFSGWGGAPHNPLGRPARAAPADPLPDVRAGDRWRFTVRLRRPHGLRNPHGFDHELFLFEQGVRAVGTVRPGGERLGASWRHPVERWRQRVRDDLMATVADRRAAGVLAALAVGDQSAIVVAVNKPVSDFPGKRPRPSSSLANSRFTRPGCPSTDEALKAYLTVRTASNVEEARPLETGHRPVSSRKASDQLNLTEFPFQRCLKTYQAA